jgi:hypothetical protein
MAIPIANHPASRRVATSSDATSEPTTAPAADRSRQCAAARFADFQQIDGDHHSEHRQRPAGECLRGGQANEQRQVTVPDDGVHTLRRLDHQVLPWRGRSWRSLIVDSQQYQSCPQRGSGGNREHRGDAGEPEQHCGNDRA